MLNINKTTACTCKLSCKIFFQVTRHYRQVTREIKWNHFAFKIGLKSKKRSVKRIVRCTKDQRCPILVTLRKRLGSLASQPSLDFRFYSSIQEVLTKSASNLSSIFFFEKSVSVKWQVLEMWGLRFSRNLLTGRGGLHTSTWWDYHHNNPRSSSVTHSSLFRF